MSARGTGNDGAPGEKAGRGPARKRWMYYALMAFCLVLFVSAWAFVRLWSIPAAIGMCVVAMAIPPIAAIVANRGEPGASWPREGPEDRTDAQRRETDEWRDGPRYGDR